MAEKLTTAALRDLLHARKNLKIGEINEALGNIHDAEEKLLALDAREESVQPSSRAAFGLKPKRKRRR